LSLSNQPLLIVDGVRVANSTVGAYTAPTFAGPTSGRFNDIDPAEIESVEIVKGPSAATLYGTDAANGVIVVKTKSGNTGPPRWSAFAEGGTLTFDRDRFPTSYFPWGHLAIGSPGSSRCTLLGVAAGTCAQDSITSFSPLRHAETTPIGTGSRYKLGLQVRGGSSIRYLLSATQESETGYLKMPTADRVLLEEQAGRALTSEELHPNGVSRYSVRGNFKVPITNSADIDISTALSRADIRIPDPGAILFGGVSTGEQDQNDGWLFGMRAGDYMIKRNREHVSHFTGGVRANWHPNAWLVGRLTTGLDLSTDYIDRLAPAGLGFTAATLQGSRENTKVNVTLQTVDAGISALLPISRELTSRSSIGAQYNRRSALTNTAAAQNLVPGAETVAGGAVPLVSETTVESVVAGAYLEETLGWRDRLYLTGAARIDGASSFGAGFHAAVYPKASFSWLVSEEPFWPAVPGVSSLRLRAAYGKSGVQPGPVAALQAETLFPAAIGSGAATGARLGAVGNRDLRPERQREFEGGVDAEFLGGRFGVQFTYYDKRSDDALVSVALPASFGGGTQWQNVGAVRNRGYEALVQAQVLSTSLLDWSVALTGSVNDNTVLAIAPSVEAIYRTGTVLPSLVRGYPLKSYFDFPIENVSDANGDGIITPSEVTVGNVPTFAGSGYPRTQLSGTTTFGLLGDRLKIAGIVEHRSGYVVANIAESLRCIFGACAGTTFRNVGFSAQAANVARGTASLHNTYWGYYEDGSFTRLRELSVTYSIPRAITSRLRVNTASVTLSGRNLALWSAYSGTDPEVQSAPGDTQVAAAFDRTGVPAPAYWLLRFNVGF
jgi:TonB-dependent SusC/RagA subfamily outer membrane receptor